jgi:hypothetical protein
MPLLGALFAIVLVVACGGGATDTFTGPETLKIKSVSATSFTGKMGDVVVVSFDVDGINDPMPPFGTKVVFTASDGGVAQYDTLALGPDGTGEMKWRLGPAVKVQTLTVAADGMRPLVFKANVTGNAWSVTTVGSMRYVTRLADEGSIMPDNNGEPWASTLFGSAPRLVISCQAGTVGVAITHPNMIAWDDYAAYRFNDVGPWTEETWSEVASKSDSLFHPGPNTMTGALAKRIAASSIFRLAYRQGFVGATYFSEVTPSFSALGLAQVMPQLMGNCPAGR